LYAGLCRLQQWWFGRLVMQSALRLVNETIRQRSLLFIVHAPSSSIHGDCWVVSSPLLLKPAAPPPRLKSPAFVPSIAWPTVSESHYSLAGGSGVRRCGMTLFSASSIAAPSFAQRGGLQPTLGSGTLSCSHSSSSSSPAGQQRETSARACPGTISSISSPVSNASSYGMMPSKVPHWKTA
jgi:hypothetical protein